MSEPPWASSFAWGALFATAFYPMLRVGQRLAGTAPDPALVSWSIHSGFFWRALIAGFAGGLAVWIARAAERASAGRLDRVLPACVLGAALLLGLQAIFVP